MAALPAKEFTTKQVKGVRFGFYTDDEVRTSQMILSPPCDASGVNAYHVDINCRSVASVSRGLCLLWFLTTSRTQCQMGCMTQPLAPSIRGQCKDPCGGSLTTHSKKQTHTSDDIFYAYCRCTTCNLSASHCPGHFGHIELPLPVYNPLIFRWAHSPAPLALYSVPTEICSSFPMQHHVPFAPEYVLQLLQLQAEQGRGMSSVFKDEEVFYA